MKTKIVVTYDPPPIPIRQFDWRAMFEDYDGSMRNSHIGYGPDEHSAVVDLLLQEGLLTVVDGDKQ